MTSGVRERRREFCSGRLEMTAEELADGVAVRLLADYRERGGDMSRIMSEGGISWMVEKAIREAVAEEREACAKVAALEAEDFNGIRDFSRVAGAKAIAAAILARGATP
jgi:hypothetical protein